MKLFSLALAALVAASAMPAAARPFHHGPARCHMEYHHHHRVQVCHR